MSYLQGKQLVSALQKVMQFYFGDVKKETLLAISGANEEVFDIKALLGVVDDVNLFAQVEDFGVERLERFMLPAIIYDDNGNVMVVQGLKSNSVSVYYPSQDKTLEVPRSKLKTFNHTILFFRDKKEYVLTNRTKSLSWFYEPIKASWRAYVEVGFLSVFINIFALALPLFTMNVYNRIVPNFATDTLFVLGGGVLIIFLFEIILKSARVYILENTAKQVGAHLEEALLKRVLGIKIQYDNLLAGSKANLFRELSQIKEFFTSRTLVQILDLPFFLIAIVVIYLIDPIMSLIPLIAGVILVAFNLIMQIPMANLAHEQFKKAQTKHGFLVESIAGRDAIKLVNGHTHRLFTWSRVVAFYEKLAHKIQLLHHFVSNSSYTIIQIVTILVVAVGVYQIQAKELSVGGLIAITILSSRAMVPIVNISGVLLNFKKMKDSLESINEFWHLPREVSETTQVGLSELQGEIVFDHVSYFYQGAKFPSLDDVSLTIKPGEKVGMIGPTGAGKSTLMRLIALLDTPTKGSVYIDGIESTTIHPIELRQYVGVMPQNPFLFAGTIAENIALSRSISKDKIASLISLTGLYGLIKKGAVGTELEVGENGENLSTGQKHLVALARALVDDPKVLVLDEPTTGLDIGLENQVIKNLQPIVEDKTLILITHRYSALKLVDRVIVINDGKVVADGKRDDILRALQGEKQ